jgi:hypothetical protein
MKKIPAVILIIFLFVISVLEGSAQNRTLPKLTLEDLYQNNTFQSKGINAVRWMKDNKRYSALEENTTTSGKDIVAYDAESGKREKF